MKVGANCCVIATGLHTSNDDNKNRVTAQAWRGEVFPSSFFAPPPNKDAATYTTAPPDSRQAIPILCHGDWEQGEELRPQDLACAPPYSGQQLVSCPKNSLAQLTCCLVHAPAREPAAVTIHAVASVPPGARSTAAVTRNFQYVNSPPACDAVPGNSRKYHPVSPNPAIGTTPRELFQHAFSESTRKLMSSHPP